MAIEEQEVTIRLPKPLLERLNDFIPDQQHNFFIKEAIVERLNIVEQNAVLEEAMGAWSDTHHSDMKNGEDIDKWLKNLRQGW